MREILFRGKCVDSGEWVYGNLIEDKWGDDNGNTIYAILQDRVAPGIVELWTPVRVIPETVGQYTGFTDKNGERIFEGDIVAFDRDNRHKGDVQFDWGVFGVEWTECKHNKEMVGVRGNLHNLRTFEDGFNKEVVVIGKKWDNPELLEVKK